VELAKNLRASPFIEDVWKDARFIQVSISMNSIFKPKEQGKKYISTPLMVINKEMRLFFGKGEGGGQRRLYPEELRLHR
jgi:hypothetical protein